MSAPGPLAAVVFDLDGLLVDSEPLQLRAWDVYLQRHGAALTPELLGRMLGLRAVDSSELVARELGLPVGGAQVMRERDEIFLATVPGNVRAMRGAADLIAELRARGVARALATSGHRRYADLALASAGLSGSFDVEVTGDLVERGKPAPDTYLRAAQLLGVEPERCLALEDAPNGVASAKAAGMLCFAIPDADADATKFAEADAILPSLVDVIGELERRGALP